MSVPAELKWLYNELWAWRAFGLIILVLAAGIEFMKWRDLSRHAVSVDVYQAQSVEKDARELGMISKNWEGLRNLDADVRQVNDNIYGCLRCHAHPSSLTKSWSLPDRPEYKKTLQELVPAHK
jgi:hypothetical protein